MLKSDPSSLPNKVLEAEGPHLILAMETNSGKESRGMMTYYSN